MKKIILASQSPRRIQLLKEIGLKFTAISSDFEEKDTHLTAKDLVIHNALGKAQKVAQDHKNSIIIGADTAAALNDHIINKPKDHQDALRMLKLLSGSTHEVLTGICIIDTETGKTLCHTEVTTIFMDEMTEEQINSYLASGEGEDKAASYAIQGKGSLYIKKIDGDYFNVVGLPIYRLRKMLQEFGIEIA